MSFGLEKPPGALVASVDQTGPAAKGGLRPGEVIVGFNGKPIDSSGELPALVAATKPGATVNVRVLRSGAEQNVNLTVGELPSGPTTLAAGTGGRSRRESGVRPGDVIVGVNGKPAKSVEELKTAIDSAGKHVALLVERGDARLFVPVEIG
jgi:serine protease Do